MNRRVSENAGRRAALTLSFSVFLAALGTSIANVALPSVMQDFGVSFEEAQWVLLAYLAGLTGFTLPAGRLGDRLGRKRMLVAGLFLFSSASALCAPAPSLAHLVLARFAQGAGAAFLTVLAVALARDMAAEGRAGRAMGLIGSMSAAGTASGPLLGGALTAYFGWPSVFFVLAPAGLIAGVLALRLSDPAVAGPGRRARPGVFLPRGLIFGLTANLMVANVMMATLLAGPFYLSISLGLDAAAMGLVMSAGPIIAMLAGAPSGRLADRMGPAPVLSLGLCLLSLGAFAFAVLPGLAGYLLAVVILTPGYQLFLSANNVMVLAQAPETQRGVASALLGLSRNLGLIAGASLMGWLFAAGVGTGDFTAAGPADIHAGFRLVFITGGGLTGGALLVFRLSSRPCIRQDKGKGERRR